MALPGGLLDSERPPPKLPLAVPCGVRDREKRQIEYFGPIEPGQPLTVPSVSLTAGCGLNKKTPHCIGCSPCDLDLQMIPELLFDDTPTSRAAPVIIIKNDVPSLPPAPINEQPGYLALLAPKWIPPEWLKKWKSCEAKAGNAIGDQIRMTKYALHRFNFPISGPRIAPSPIKPMHDSMFFQRQTPPGTSSKSTSLTSGTGHRPSCNPFAEP